MSLSLKLPWNGLCACVCAVYILMPVCDGVFMIKAISRPLNQCTISLCSVVILWSSPIWQQLGQPTLAPNLFHPCLEPANRRAVRPHACISPRICVEGLSVCNGLDQCQGKTKVAQSDKPRFSRIMT